MGWRDLNRRRIRIPATRLDQRPLREALALLPAGALLVDLGAGGRRISSTTFTIDGDSRCAPDLVCDLHHVPLDGDRFDGAVCTGTLEHVRDPEGVGREIVRLLKRGGLAYIDVPFMQGFHADPDDYRRWTAPGLRLFCERIGLEVVSSGVHIGPGSALSWIASEYARILVGEKAGRVASLVVRTLFLPALLLDRWAVRRRDAFQIAAGVYVVARKPGTAARQAS